MTREEIQELERKMCGSVSVEQYIKWSAESMVAILNTKSNAEVAQHETGLVYAEQKMAEMGRPLSMVNVGIYYMNGMCGKKDLKMAEQWTRKAIQTGDPVAVEIGTEQLERIKREKRKRTLGVLNGIAMVLGLANDINDEFSNK